MTRGNRLWIAIVSSLTATFIVGALSAAPYSNLVVGDMGGAPPDTAGGADLGNLNNCLAGLSTCPPGCDAGGAPPNTCSAPDLGNLANYLNGGALAFNPATGYVNFSAAPGNPAFGSGTYNVLVDNVTTGGAGPSGFNNPRGQFAIRAAITVNTTPASTITAPTAMVDSGNGLVAAATLRARGQSGVTLTCNGVGNVTIRYYTTSYKRNVAAGELCAGVACAGGNHWDQFDLVVNCPIVGGETLCADGLDNDTDTLFDCADPDCNGLACAGNGVNSCSAADTCAAGVCNNNNSAAGAACGTQGVECKVNDTCDGAGACTDNGNVANGTPCTDDTLFCTGAETCQTGACTSAGNPCTPVVQTCNEATNTCDPVASYVIDLQEQGSGGTVNVDLVINTSGAVAGANNLGGYDVTITYDSTLATFACPTGISQPSPAFNEALLNQCVVDTSVPTAAKIRIADVNASKTTTTGPVVVKTLQFTGVTGAQTINVALTNGDANNLLNYDAVTVNCGGACATSGALLAP